MAASTILNLSNDISSCFWRTGFRRDFERVSERVPPGNKGRNFSLRLFFENRTFSKKRPDFSPDFRKTRVKIPEVAEFSRLFSENDPNFSADRRKNPILRIFRNKRLFGKVFNHKAHVSREDRMPTCFGSHRPAGLPVVRQEDSTVIFITFYAGVCHLFYTFGLRRRCSRSAKCKHVCFCSRLFASLTA